MRDKLNRDGKSLQFYRSEQTSEGEESGCRTQHMPWADGTACGRDDSNKITNWCIKSECIEKTESDIVRTIDGQWNEWQG